MIERLKQRAREMKQEVVALYFAARDPETPRVAKVITWFVAAYALSPIDLIPDFIPVIGYLDDLIIVPLGIKLAIRMVPPEVMQRARERAAVLAERHQSREGLIIVLLVWLAAVAALTILFVTRR